MAINASEKHYFERTLGMDTGYVGDFSDRTFGNFFSDYGIDIHSEKYQIYGTSKAKKLRAFWELEPDTEKVRKNYAGYSALLHR